MDRRTKELVANELHEKLKDFKLAVLTGYSGMDVAKMTALRVVLRKSNAELRVVKNSLLSIASRETSFSALDGNFKGPLALAITYGDVIETTKALVDFAKKCSPEKIVLMHSDNREALVKPLSEFAEVLTPKTGEIVNL